MNTYFPGISKVAYEGPKSTNPLAFRYYTTRRRSWRARPCASS